MSLIEILAPLDGWLMPLAEVPDPVFAGGMAGAGIAIDPVGGTLRAPCRGTVKLMRSGRHALMLATGGGDLLLHLGIDTVQLKGEGFRLLVEDGVEVSAGTPLLAFDADLIARRAPSLVTPVLMTGIDPGSLTEVRAPGPVCAGDVLFRVPARAGKIEAASNTTASASRTMRVPFDHGLHARPAATLVAALAGLRAEVELHAGGRSASARSMVAMMALGLGRGDLVEARARGADAAAAIEALSALFAPATAPDTTPAPIASSAVHPAATPVPGPGTDVSATVASRGLAIGSLHRLTPTRLAPTPARGDARGEQAALEAALASVREQLGARLAASDGVRRGVVEAHLALLADPGLHDATIAAVTRGASASEGWHRALAAAAEALGRVDDPRMRERRADLQDLEQQVLAALAGVAPDGAPRLPPGAVLVTNELLPSQLIALEAARLGAICTAEGGATSHVAILAASLGVPMLVAAGSGVLGLAEGTPLVVDAEAGRLYVAPDAVTRRRFEARIAARAKEAAEDARLAMQPAQTRDGTTIRVDCNLGAVAEAAPARAAGADGCGLLRTEFLFLERDVAPGEDEQVAVYTQVAAGLGARCVTIRTLDAGGDKPIPFLPMPREENPALGLRGLRSGLWQRPLLETQLRAILRAGATIPCRLLLPMVTDVADVVAVRELLARLVAETGAPMPAIGVMIETPASALLADQLAPLVDFFSIGTNDLSQYTLAIDRLHPVLAGRLDAIHPAVLRLVAGAAAARSQDREVCVCGGLAADPDAVPILLGLGVRELSVPASRIGRIKNIVRGLDLASCERLARVVLALPSAAEVRSAVHRALAAPVREGE